ncbi:hypothetical protein FOA52_016211 [Chlamydomonas sp. UWO 241]|nr:hypothetical protein FOA52_016211 [Chlamydomonas sp. UWO 241]
MQPHGGWGPPYGQPQMLPPPQYAQGTVAVQVNGVNQFRPVEYAVPHGGGGGGGYDQRGHMGPPPPPMSHGGGPMGPGGAGRRRRPPGGRPPPPMAYGGGGGYDSPRGGGAGHAHGRAIQGQGQPRPPPRGMGGGGMGGGPMVRHDDPYSLKRRGAPSDVGSDRGGGDRRGGGDGGPAKRQRPLASPEELARDIKDIRSVLRAKVIPIVDKCREDGISEMVPEIHGYPLSRIREDFRATFERDIDLRRHGGVKLAELVSRHSADLVVIVMTLTSAAVILPKPGVDFGDGAIAPPAIAPARTGPNGAPATMLVAERDERAKWQTSAGSGGATDAPGGTPAMRPGAAREVIPLSKLTPARSVPSIGGVGTAGDRNPYSYKPAGEVGETADGGASERSRLTDGAAVRMHKAAVKYIKRRILASRFRLNQEAYRARLASHLPPNCLFGDESMPGAAYVATTQLQGGLAAVSSLQRPNERNGVIREINVAAEALAPVLAWSIESVVPALYELAAEMGVSEDAVGALDLVALLKSVAADEMPNPFKLVRPSGGRGSASSIRMQLHGVQDEDGPLALKAEPEAGGEGDGDGDNDGDLGGGEDAEDPDGVHALLGDTDGDRGDGYDGDGGMDGGMDDDQQLVGEGEADGDQQLVVAEGAEEEEGGGPAAPRLRVPPELEGVLVEPELGPHKELQTLLEVWLCLHAVLPDVHSARLAALAKARAAGELPANPPRDGGPRESYPVAALREDYRREWGKVLQLMPLAFGDLVELLQWELFRNVVEVKSAERAGEKGSLIPCFDVLADVRDVLAEFMERALAAQQSARQDAEAQAALRRDSGFNAEKTALAALEAALPPLDDVRKTFKMRFLYEPSQQRMGFNSFKALVDANSDLCSTVPARGPTAPPGSSVVVTNANVRLRTLTKVALALQLDVASLERLYRDVYGEPFEPTSGSASDPTCARGVEAVAAALSTMGDVCTVAAGASGTMRAVGPAAPAGQSSVSDKMRIRNVVSPVPVPDKHPMSSGLVPASNSNRVAPPQGRGGPGGYAPQGLGGGGMGMRDGGGMRDGFRGDGMGRPMPAGGGSGMRDMGMGGGGGGMRDGGGGPMSRYGGGGGGSGTPGSLGPMVRSSGGGGGGGQSLMASMSSRSGSGAYGGGGGGMGGGGDRGAGLSPVGAHGRGGSMTGGAPSPAGGHGGGGGSASGAASGGGMNAQIMAMMMSDLTGRNAAAPQHAQQTPSALLDQVIAAALALGMKLPEGGLGAFGASAAAAPAVSPGALPGPPQQPVAQPEAAPVSQAAPAYGSQSAPQVSGYHGGGAPAYSQMAGYGAQAQQQQQQLAQQQAAQQQAAAQQAQQQAAQLAAQQAQQLAAQQAAQQAQQQQQHSYGSASGYGGSAHGAHSAASSQQQQSHAAPSTWQQQVAAAAAASSAATAPSAYASYYAQQQAALGGGGASAAAASAAPAAAPAAQAQQPQQQQQQSYASMYSYGGSAAPSGYGSAATAAGSATTGAAASATAGPTVTSLSAAYGTAAGSQLPGLAATPTPAAAAAAQVVAPAAAGAAAAAAGASTPAASAAYAAYFAQALRSTQGTQAGDEYAKAWQQWYASQGQTAPVATAAAVASQQQQQPAQQVAAAAAAQPPAAVAQAPAQAQAANPYAAYAGYGQAAMPAQAQQQQQPAAATPYGGYGMQPYGQQQQQYGYGAQAAPGGAQAGAYAAYAQAQQQQQSAAQQQAAMAAYQAAYGTSYGAAPK